jgi:hypothetical protein
MPTSFAPYKIYQENIKSISDFQEITAMSISFAEKLFEKYPKEQLEKIDHGVLKNNQLSYCAADRTNNPIMVKAWLTVDEYAKHVSLPVEEIIAAVANGELGEIKIHPKTGKEVIYWAEKDEDNDKKPEPGSYAFKNSITVTAAIEVSEDTKSDIDKLQQLLISIGHSRGADAELSKSIEENLCKSILILHWTAFENFLRQTIQELYRLHPELLTRNKQAKKPSISYDEIHNFTSGFTSTENLRAYIVQKEIDSAESEEKSVHGLINYIKSNFVFKDDPYTSWYMVKGKKVDIVYKDLMEVKDTRNTLIHDAGYPQKDFFIKYPNVPNRDLKVIIDEEHLLRCVFILRAIAHNINTIIQKKEYSTQTGASLGAAANSD